MSLQPQYQHQRLWWKEAVVYQIYPSSFLDSNGDGIGDIPGIISKLPYLANLGVNCVWLSPHYASPQVDMGYDISDFEDIYPPYGTLDDCQNLIDSCHKHGIKIIFDLVINHTSDQHEWFKESRSSKNNPKRNWYFWKPPKGWNSNGRPIPPNNWRSSFGGSVWEFDDKTGEFYFHLYAKEQPDLNWEIDTIRKAIYDTSMHFWLKRGVDGFRIDVVNKYSKNVDFPDAPVVDSDSFEQNCAMYVNNGLRMHEFLSEMNDVLAQYRCFDGGPIMTVGELPGTPREADVRAYVSAAAKQLSMVFNFDTVALGQVPGDRTKLQPYPLHAFKDTLAMWQIFVNGTDAWTTVFLENHDQGRSISRFGDDSSELLRKRSGKLLAMILITMTGTLFLYQGQEIGMVNMPLEWDLSEYKDIWSTNMVKQLRDQSADERRLSEARQGLQKEARDNARTPMQWSADAHGGFSAGSAEPWMRVNDNYQHLNVEREEADPGSIFNFWKELIKLRNQNKDAWVYGDYELLDTEDVIFAFVKSGGGKKFTTVANTSQNPVAWTTKSKLFISNMEDNTSSDTLQPWEARVYADD